MAESVNIIKLVEQLNQIGIALSSEKDTTKLLENILLSAKDISNADGGTLYMLTEEKKLKFEIIRTDSLKFSMGGTSGVDIPFPAIPLYDEKGNPNDKMVVTSAVLKQEIINIPDAYQADNYDFSGTKKFDENTGYRSTSFLTVPMKNHEDNVIGVLQLLNAVDRTSGEIIPFSPEVQTMVASLSSQASVALTNKMLIENLRELFHSIIRMIADAIDEKSEYTGGHCRRVPIITMMLAEAVNADTDGFFKDVYFNEKKMYELEIAAWLHDCGKLVTPVHVVDKSTKLETIHDRVNMVDHRFELARKELENKYLKGRLVTYESFEMTEDEYHDRLEKLESDLEFIHKANVGGEFMTDDSKARVAEISERYQWSDGKGQQNRLLSEEEIYNLNIERGTLTEEEREIINNHVVMSLKMLNSLPFPNDLKDVAEIAGSHHEKIDGTGYPRGLTGDQMSIQAKMLAIADVFEALMASDRPYRPTKKLSEGIKIMGFMTKDKHIDQELFNLFIGKKVYLRYADEHLKQDQIDEVDESKIPGYVPR